MRRLEKKGDDFVLFFFRLLVCIGEARVSVIRNCLSPVNRRFSLIGATLYEKIRGFAGFSSINTSYLPDYSHSAVLCENS